MKFTKIILLFFVVLMLALSITASTIDIIKTDEWNDFTSGTGSNNCIFESSHISSTNLNDCTYYSNLYYVNNSIELDKILFSDGSNFKAQLKTMNYSFFDTEYNNKIFELKFNNSFKSSENEDPITNYNYTTLNIFDNKENFGMMRKNATYSRLEYNDSSTNFNYSKGIMTGVLVITTPNANANTYLFSNQDGADGFKQLDTYFQDGKLVTKSYNGSSPSRTNNVSIDYPSNNYGNIIPFTLAWDSISGNFMTSLYGNTYSLSNEFQPIKDKQILGMYFGGNGISSSAIQASYNISLGNIKIYDTIPDFSVLNNSKKYWQYWTGSGVPAIVFHEVASETIGNNSHPYAISASNFTKVIKWLYDEDFETVTMNEYYECYYQNNCDDFPEKPIMLTFDDGLNTTRYVAAPIMEQYGFIGTCGVVTDWLSGDPSEKGAYSGLEIMNWNAASELKNVYGWEIASHTSNHTNGNSIHFNKAVNDSYYQICGNLTSCPTSFIYPNYVVNDTAKNSENVSLLFKVARGDTYFFLNDENTNPVKLSTTYTVENINFNFETFVKAVMGNVYSQTDYFDSYINKTDETRYIKTLNGLDSSSALQFRINTTDLNAVRLFIRNKNLISSYPDIIKYDNTITYLNANYSISEKKVLLDCTGTGNIDITNLNTIKGTYGYYDVYHNGIFVEYSNTNDYTTSSCSTWEFRTSDYKSVISEASRDSLNPMLGAFGIIALTIVVAAGFALVKAFESGDGTAIAAVAAMAIGLAIVLIIGAYILGNVSTIVP